MGFSHSAGLLKSSPKMIDKKKMKFRLVSSCLIMAVVIDFMSLLKNVDIYMDTTDWALLKNKLSLRYRLSNNTAMYTMKSVNAIEDGIAKRTETEIVLKKPAHPPNGTDTHSHEPAALYGNIARRSKVRTVI